MLVFPGELSKARWRWPVKDSSCTKDLCGCVRLPCWFSACMSGWYRHREGAWGTGNLSGSSVCSWGLLDAESQSRYAGIKWGSESVIASLFRFCSTCSLHGLWNLSPCFLRTAQTLGDHHSTHLTHYRRTVLALKGNEPFTVKQSLNKRGIRSSKFLCLYAGDHSDSDVTVTSWNC